MCWLLSLAFESRACTDELVKPAAAASANLFVEQRITYDSKDKIMRRKRSKNQRKWFQGTHGESSGEEETCKRYRQE